MLNAGANWKELQARMGHKSIKTTMDIYAELAPMKHEYDGIDGNHSLVNLIQLIAFLG